MSYLKNLSCVFLMLSVVFAIHAETPRRFVSQSRWIWFESPEITTGDCYYRKSIKFSGDVEHLEIICYLDDAGELYLNGKAQKNTWIRGENISIKARKFVLTGQLEKGACTIAVHAKNVKRSGGLMLLGKIIYASGKAEYFHSDKSWKASPYAPAGWNTTSFNDSSWLPAKEFMDVTAAPWAEKSQVQTLCRTPEELRNGDQSK